MDHINLDLNWYYENIEPEIMSYVVMLRNGGWNTTRSCGHEMTVEIDISNMEDVERLATCLMEHGVEKFRMEPVLIVTPGQIWRRWVIVYFSKGDEKK